MTTGNRNLGLTLLASLVLAPITSGAAPPMQRAPGGHASMQTLPCVEVSHVEVQPQKIDLLHKGSRRAAIVTVQIHHDAVSLNAGVQTVTLEVGSFSTSPARTVSAVYKPPNQVIKIQPGPGGVVVARVNVERVHIGSSSTATLIISASLANPSSDIGVAVSPARGDWTASLRIER